MFGQGKKTYPLYSVERDTKKQRLNPSLPKQIKTSPDLEGDVLIAQKELQKSIQDDQGIVDDKSEDQAIRGRAKRKENKKNQELIDALENEIEELEEGTSLIERVRKHLQEVWLHSLSCYPRSWNNDCNG